MPYRYRMSRRLVLTTPEAIIEQASTAKLLDDLIDESVRTSARRPLIMQFDPSSGWIWKRWKGTIFSETWDACVYRMVYASVVYLICRSFPQCKDSLSGISTLWGQLLSVTTFTLTFFVNQSYALWKKCTSLSRRLQGRLHDLDMTLASHAVRKAPTSPNEPSTYTAGSRQVLELVSRYVRLFNLLTYASFTRSHRPILTPRGMRRLVERGLMTPLERQILADAEIPATQRHNALLLWIIRAFIEGTEAGHFTGDAGFEQQFMEKAHVCRASYGAIGDELQGRMPLAYAHIVQVLVDLVLWMYPFMGYSVGMSGLLCVFGTGLLTIGYQGLFDLAKQFLDPYDNENYGKGEDPLVVDTLIAETNAGSVRWMNGLAEFPVPSQKFTDGELSDYLLPVRGYSVEELIQMDEEKKELEKKRLHEEKERKLAEEYAQQVQEASELLASNKFQFNTTKAWAQKSDGTHSLVHNKTRDRTRIEVALGSFPLRTAELVTDAIFSQNSNASSLQHALIPAGTAPATAYVEEASIEEVNDEMDEPNGVKLEPERTLFGGEDVDDDEAFEVVEDWGTEASYVHKFDAFDPYLDLPTHDEVGPDGKEYRLSQMLADEVWEEEIEAAKEKESIRSYEEYVERVRELKDAKASELLETEEILRAGANADETSQWLLSKDNKATDSSVYDQTKLDGMSQLFGLPPDELSEIPSYVEPPVPEVCFDSTFQLWDTGLAPEKQPSAGDTRVAPEDEEFLEISQLWGGEFEDDSKVQPSPSAASGVSAPATEVEDDEKSDLLVTEAGSDAVGARLSQMLADEVWVSGDEAASAVHKPLTFEDYKRQVQEILEAEKEERLETEAIMNAPPGADGYDVPEKDRPSTIRASNNTEAADVDLAVLEMDAPLNATQIEEEFCLPNNLENYPEVDTVATVTYGNSTELQPGLDAGAIEGDRNQDDDENDIMTQNR